jgi:biopolymer transport protein ExbD
MITTPVIEQYNRIDLPNQNSDSNQKPPEQEDKFITIDASGDYNWGQDSVTRPELESLLDQVAQGEGEQPTIHLRGDRTLPYQEIMDVINMLKSRNLTKLSLDTKAG